MCMQLFSAKVGRTHKKNEQKEANKHERRIAKGMKKNGTEKFDHTSTF